MNLTIPGILVVLSDGDKAKTAGLMRELATENITDSPGTRHALMRLVRATFAVLDTGTMESVTAYLGMGKKDMSPDVVRAASTGSPQDVLIRLAERLEASVAKESSGGTDASPRPPLIDVRIPISPWTLSPDQIEWACAAAETGASGRDHADEITMARKIGHWKRAHPGPSSDKPPF